MTEENFSLKVLWTGNQAGGTTDIESFERSLILTIENKPVIYGTSTLKKYKKPIKFTAEELFASSISMAFMLHFLELSAANGIVITRYVGHTNMGVNVDFDGSVSVKRILLHPEIFTGETGFAERATQLAIQAKESCGLIRQTLAEIVVLPKISIED